MTEKLQPNNTQSKFDQFKSWLNKTQTDSMNANLEISATGQTPLQRAMARLEGLITGDNTKIDTLAQDLIDYRYEMARLERKAERESKGQTFEQAVLEDIAIKEQAKKELAKAKIEQPTTNSNNSEKSKPTNTITDRLKALAALALLSGNMMMTPNAIAGDKSKVETNSPTKVEQVKKETQTDEQQVKTIDQLIAGKGVSKGGIKAGLSAQGLEAKFTIRANHNGENPSKITITVKDQVAKARQLIKQGQSEPVAYILTSLESDNAKAQKANDESNKKLSDERIYKEAIAGLKGKEDEKNAKVKTNQSATKTLEVKPIQNKVEKELKPFKVQYFDPELPGLVDHEFKLKENVELLEAMTQDDKCDSGWYKNCKKSGKVYDRNMEFEINGKKYVNLGRGNKLNINTDEKVTIFYPYDKSKPETVNNINIFSEGNGVFIKATHEGKVVYIRPMPYDFASLQALAKNSGIGDSFMCNDCSIGYENTPDSYRTAVYFQNRRRITRGWFGGLEVSKDERFRF
jgi:hypothetical protein